MKTELKESPFRSDTAINIEHWSVGAFLKMGSLQMEQIYDKVCDFAMGFEADQSGRVHWLGYSLFQTDKRGAYSGNYLMSNEDIRQFICNYVSPDHLIALENILPSLLSQLIQTDYHGYLGVDMMVY